VTWLFGDQLQQDVAQIAVIEDAGKPPAAATTMLMSRERSATAKAETASRVPPSATCISMFHHDNLLSM
jgi:hypothetical protein